MNIPLFVIHLPIDEHMSYFWFWLLWTFMSKFLYRYMIVFPLAMYLGMELLDFMVAILNFWWIAILFSKAVISFYSSTNNIVFDFSIFLSIPVIVYILYYTTLFDVRWYLIMVLVCFYLMIYSVAVIWIWTVSQRPTF